MPTNQPTNHAELDCSSTIDTPALYTKAGPVLYQLYYHVLYCRDPEQPAAVVYAAWVSFACRFVLTTNDQRNAV